MTHALWRHTAYLALCAYFCAPLMVHPDGLSAFDWDEHFVYYASVVKNVFEYGQMPFWNPWYCGGNVLWQNPQVALLSPVYLLVPLVSLALAVKLSILLHYLVGFVGMDLLLRRGLGLRFFPVVLFLGSLFVLGGSPTLHLAVGHTTFLPLFYLPLELFLFLRALQTWKLRYVFGAGVVAAVGIYNGGIHPVTMSSVALACFGVVATATRWDWRPLAIATIFGLSALAFSAPKLVPVYHFLGDSRLLDIRGAPGRPDSMTLPMLRKALLDPRSTGPGFPEQKHGWHEYGNYVGGLAVALIAASLGWVGTLRSWKREEWLGVSLAATSLMCLLLAMGDFAPLAPYTLLRELPVFSQFRAPGRYLSVFVLFATATSGWALVRAGLGDLTIKDGLPRLAALVLVLATIGLAFENRSNFRDVFGPPLLGSTFKFLKPSHHLVIDAETNGSWPDSPMLRGVMDDRSVLNCYEPFQVRRSVDPGRDVVYSDDPTAIYRTEFSPNRLRFVAMARGESARVYLNQNYIAGWRSTLGRILIDPQTDRPYVELDKHSAGAFSFSFTPPGLWLGLVIGVVGLAVSALLLGHEVPTPNRAREWSRGR